MSEWKPIDTAPKDGTTVLLSTLDIDAAQYVIAAFFEGSADFGGSPDDGPGWYLYPTNGNHQVIGEPTHWMPLPQPPVQDKGEG